MGVRHVKPIEALTRNVKALVNILIICFDMCITHTAMESHEPVLTRRKEGKPIP